MLNWNGNKYDGSLNIMAKHNRIEHNNDKWLMVHSYYENHIISTLYNLLSGDKNSHIYEIKIIQWYQLHKVIDVFKIPFDHVRNLTPQ